MSKEPKFLVKLIATFFGVGYLTFIPATWASAVTAIASWFLYDGLLYWIVGLSIVGFWACRPATVVFKSADPKQFVMDEVCGMMVSILWLPKTVPLFFAAFILFRILDAWKPWPICLIQENKHPSSILWDDLVAGLFANLILQGITRITTGLG